MSGGGRLRIAMADVQDGCSGGYSDGGPAPMGTSCMICKTLLSSCEARRCAISSKCSCLEGRKLRVKSEGVRRS